MVAHGNPLSLHSLADVAALRARFVHRQAGSGTRLLLEHLCQQARVAPAQLVGHGLADEDSHLAVAAAVASGAGDAGLGIAAAASQFGLDFVPLVEEDYFLVCLQDALEQAPVQLLRCTRPSSRVAAIAMSASSCTSASARRCTRSAGKCGESQGTTTR